MESLELRGGAARHWLAALCVCSGRCVMAACGARQSQAWNERFTQSILEWLDVAEADRQDIRGLPHGDAANDALLLALRCRRADEERRERGEPLPSGCLDTAADPERLFSGLVLACLGVTAGQLARLGEAGADERLLRPLEYDARSRAAAFVIGEWLEMPRQFVALHEARAADALEHAAADAALGAAGARALEGDRQRGWGWRRCLAAGAGVAVAGTLVGVTAGLAAPLMAAGMGAAGIGGLGFLATTGGAAMVGSLFGVAGGGLVGRRFHVRLRGLREFYFTRLLPEQGVRSLHATILVPGFVDPAAAASPFAPIRDVMGLDLGEAFTLYFETRELAALQGAFAGLVGGAAKSAATSLVLRQTALGGVVGALAWPLAILSLGQLVDAPWAVGVERAKRAGRLLADVLADRAHGKRPVTLVGYSLGALAIFTCLRELRRRGAFGIVETAVLLGIPADSEDRAAWAECCECVSRSVVVGYSKCDWVLAFLFRTSVLCRSLAGLSGVDAGAMFRGQPLMRRKLACVDLAGVVEQHNDYLARMDEVIARIWHVL
ncbi:Transmembrane and coiled-coil domain-containing protein 4 [Coemansia javaensis]|uniref:Transmembrane and coiled-coil domain-containing protein 4 n=1 Tax=Coemansia javaensis TaxID=2761396 RepID=A0A9W8HDE0_9FUNG|nr:Transmembrane and coiled-coil domain-containing protein 4 [Coemansia javaensis]